MKVKTVLLLLVVVLLVGTLAAAALFFVQRGGRAKEQKPPVKGLFSAGEIVTNLAPTEGRRFIRVKVEIETRDEKSVQELTRNYALVRDHIIAVLRSKSAEDVAGDTGMAALARDIAQRLSNLVPSAQITNVYFVEFVVQ